MVEHFQVESKLWSDHMPITFSLRNETLNEQNVNQTSMGKYKLNINNVNKYKSELNSAIDRRVNSNDFISIEDLNELIKQTIPNNKQCKPPSNEKWFNWECFTLRKESFKALRRFERSNSEADRLVYLETNKKYNTLCLEVKNNYLKNIELKLNTIKDSKEWWQLVKELKTDKLIRPSVVRADEFRAYFLTLLNPEETCLAISYAPNFVACEFLDRDITVNDIQKMIENTKQGKAAGEDRISYEFYRYVSPEFQTLIAKAFNHLYENCIFDKTFETSILFPIFKKGDRSLVSNYRGISFMNCIAKVLMGILTDRLTTWVNDNKILNEFQAGFRSKYSTVDNIYNLCSIVNIKLQEKKKVYAFFVDFRAAFDKVSRSHLFYKLHALGVSTKFLNFLICIYGSTKFKILSNGEYSNPFETHTGLKQGCLMSPILFSIYLNDLHEYLEGGLYIDDLNVRLLMYADDIVILSEDINVLQKMIEKLEEYCEIWNMEVNLEKSAIMVFRNGGRLSSAEKWKYKGENVKIVSEYTYLGVIITPKLSFQKHLESRNSVAKSGMNAVWKEFLGNKVVSLSAKYKMFEAVSRSIQCYAAQVWGSGMFDTVDKLQIYFIKKILRLPDCTPTYSIFLESKICCSHLYSLNLHINYIRKTLFEYAEERLPRILSRKILDKGIYWAKKLNDLCQQFEINYNISTQHVCWKRQTNILLKCLQNEYLNKMWEKAMSSNRIYKQLDHHVGGSYLTESIERYKITWILKCRVDLILLDKNTNCTLCNLNEWESLQHFLGRCPILKRIRLFYFGKPELSNANIIDCLNGVNDANW